MLEKTKQLIKISVIGGSRIKPGSPVYNAAFKVGQNIASSGAILVCGGLTGVMEAACRGAKDKGGLTIGILPSTDKASANQWVDIPIPTGLGYARNSLVVLSGDAVIAIDGADGTLSEIGYALTFSKPLIGLNTWNIEPCGSVAAPRIIPAASPAEAVAKAMDCVIDR
ncbi:MAG: TIGR00725 family protein [Actinomycetia bacterium]|nr:TIGR00725 family protein [Actinomycetes bacterium]